MTKFKLFLAVLMTMLCVSTYAIASESGFVEGEDVISFASDDATSVDMLDFLGTVNISEIYIEDPDTGDVVTQLVKGKEYILWIYFNPYICDNYYNEIGVFKNNKMVFTTAWEGSYSGQCGISGTGIYVTVPASAPSGSYTWGARTTIEGVSDTFYPASFSIQ